MYGKQALGVSVTEGNTVTLHGILWSENQTNIGGEGFVSVTQAVSGNPVFAPDGYHLLASSTAVDQGIDTEVSSDIDGETRPIGVGYDLGADEFPFVLDEHMYLPLMLHH
jgi:hypothetical protein